jgi:glucose-6-phosphate isomerase
MQEPKDKPSIFEIDLAAETMLPYDHHIERRLSSMQNQFNDVQTYQRMLAVEDVLLYEVYDSQRPEVVGELLHGISIVHPGRVGDEYYMTKGHFHSVLETGEAYYCLKGRGFMVMENPEGEWSVEALAPGRVLYVPPRWAHRSVNTGTEDLVTFFVYPGQAGHDYGTIEKQGFRKLVIARDGQATIIDNPRWQSPEMRK